MGAAVENHSRDYVESINWRFPSGPSPQGSGNRTQEGSQRGMKDMRRTWPTKLSKQGSYGLTESEMASTGLVWVCIRSSAYDIAVSLTVFMELLTVGTDVSLALLPALGTLFLLLSCLV